MSKIRKGKMTPKCKFPNNKNYTTVKIMLRCVIQKSFFSQNINYPIAKINAQFKLLCGIKYAKAKIIPYVNIPKSKITPQFIL